MVRRGETEVLGFDDRPLAERTQRMYKREDLQWRRWCIENGELIFPASARAVSRYLEHLHTLGRSIKTLERVRAALSVAHDSRATALLDEGKAPPLNAVRDVLVTSTIARLRHDDERGIDQAEPLFYRDLVRICESQGNSLRGVRNRTMAAVAWWGLLRGSEVATLMYEDCRFEENGVSIRLRATKTDRRRKGQYVGLVRRDDLDVCPVRELNVWLERSGLCGGPVFRRIWVGANERLGDEALSYSAWDDIVRDLVSDARLPQPERYSTHSFRAGAASEAARAGISTIELMKAGRWATPAIAAEYVRLSVLTDNPMAKILR